MVKQSRSKFLDQMRKRRRRGLSSIVGAVFFIAILFVSMGIMLTMFNSFYNFTKTENNIQQINQQRQQTSFSQSSFQFGTPSTSITGNYFPETAVSTSTAANAKDTLGPGSATQYTNERKLFYAAGLYWAFYSDGTNIVYKTSQDGVTWSATSILTSASGAPSDTTEGYNFAAWVSGTSLYYVVTNYNKAKFFRFNTGTLVAAPTGSIAGTITLNTEVSVATTNNVFSYSSIVTDTSATPKVYVAVETQSGGGGGSSDIEVRVCTLTTSTNCNTAGNWALSHTYTFANKDDYPMILVPLSTTGRLALMYEDSGNSGQVFSTGAVQIQTYSGTTWTTTAVTVPSPANYDLSRSSAVAIGNIVYFAGYSSTTTGSTTGPLSFWTLTYPGTVSTPVTLDTTTANWNTGVSQNGTGSTPSIIVTYGSGTTLNWKYNPNVGTSGWFGNQTISTSETSISGLQSTYSGKWGAIWSTGASSPFSLYFTTLVTPSPNQLSVPNVITSTTQDATSSTDQSKLFYSQGLWWVFFSDGSTIAYSTSSDGVTWSAETSIITGGGAPPGAATSHGYTMSAWQSGTSIYFAVADLNGQFSWRQGVFQTSGTIAFASNWNGIGLAGGYSSTGPISIELDESGNLWVALGVLTGTSYQIQVWEHVAGAANNAFTNVLTTSATTTPMGAIILPPSSGSGAVVVYGTNYVTGQLSVANTTSGATWSTVTLSSISNYALASSSAELSSGVLYFAGLNSTTTGVSVGTLSFWSYAIGGSVGSITQKVMETSIAPWQGELIPTSSPGSLILFDGAFSTVGYYQSKNYGATWGSKDVITNTSPSVTGLTGAFVGTFAVAWTSGNFSPFSIQFVALSSISLTSSSAFPIHAVSLYITDTVTGALVIHYDENATAPGVSASFNYYISGGSTLTVPLTFSWSASTPYLVTVSTDNGVLTSTTYTSPV